MSNVLELVNIRKSFGTELVLNDLSLAVPEHTATVLIGASGSGKSTLLSCINLLESIDDGQIFLDGDEISDPLINVDDVRRRLGMVFQSLEKQTPSVRRRSMPAVPLITHHMLMLQSCSCSLLFL